MKGLYPNKRDILKLLKSGFIITAAFIAPGSLRGFGKLAPPFEKYEKRYLKRKLKELEKENLVAVTFDHGKEIVKISKEGESHLKKLELNNLKIKKIKNWDGKWRVVIFDVPEDYKKARHYFFSRLKEIGLKLLQESVFVCPYPCFTEVNALREFYGIKPYVRFIVANEIEREGELRQKFNL